MTCAPEACAPEACAPEACAPEACAPRTARRAAGRLLALVCLAPLVQGCSFDRMAADTMAPVLLRTKDNFNRETVPRFAREAGPGLLVTLDGMVLASPENLDLRLLQAEMNAAFAFGFLEEEDPAWATSLYRKARGAALAAAALEDEDLAAALEGADLGALEARLADADEDALPALFWWGFARGAEVNLNRGDTTQIAALARVDAVMQWVLEREPGFFNAGPHLYFAMRHLALPPSFGGKPAEGLTHFEAVDRLTSGRLLMAKVLRAKFHAPTLAGTPAGTPIAQVLEAQQAAWDAYYGGLKKVVDAPSDLWPEQALPNAVAKERALELLRDPEANNIITPPGAVNEYKQAPEADGAWGDDAGWADDAGGWADTPAGPDAGEDR